MPNASLPLHRSPVTCIVVEDDDLLRETLCDILREMGVDACGRADVAGLEQALCEGDPAIIFLDIGLRGCDAIDVFALLTRRGYKGWVQLVSGRDIAVRDHTRMAGEAQGLKLLPPIAKPFRFAQIRAVLNARTQPTVARPATLTPANLTLVRSTGPGEGASLSVDTQWISPATGRPALVDLAPANGPIPGVESFQAILDCWRGAVAGEHAFRRQAAASASVVIRTVIADLDASTIPSILAMRGELAGQPSLTLSFDEADVLLNPSLAREIFLRLRIQNVRVRIENCGPRLLELAELRHLAVEEMVLGHALQARPSDQTVRGLKVVTHMARRTGAAVLVRTAMSPTDLSCLADAGVDLCAVDRPARLPVDRADDHAPPVWRRVRLAELSRWRGPVPVT